MNFIQINFQWYMTNKLSLKVLTDNDDLFKVFFYSFHFSKYFFNMISYKIFIVDKYEASWLLVLQSHLIKLINQYHHNILQDYIVFISLYFYNTNFKNFHRFLFLFYVVKKRLFCRLMLIFVFQITQKLKQRINWKKIENFQ